MARIDQLLASYRRYASLPFKANLPLSQRVWFLVYPPEEERRILTRLDEFEIATKDVGRGWHCIELTGAFADWIDTFDEDERADVVGDPEVVVDYAATQFRDFVASRVAKSVDLVAVSDRANTIFAITGLMELYDFVHVSAVVEVLPSDFPGIVFVFFPGEREDNTYRFLNVRDGWDYLAVPIVPES